jgi:hypothetical protein
VDRHSEPESSETTNDNDADHRTILNGRVGFQVVKT